MLLYPSLHYNFRNQPEKLAKSPSLYTYTITPDPKHPYNGCLPRNILYPPPSLPPARPRLLAEKSLNFSKLQTPPNVHLLNLKTCHSPGQISQTKRHRKQLVDHHNCTDFFFKRVPINKYHLSKQQKQPHIKYLQAGLLPFAARG